MVRCDRRVSNNLIKINAIRDTDSDAVRMRAGETPAQSGLLMQSGDYPVNRTGVNDTMPRLRYAHSTISHPPWETRKTSALLDMRILSLKMKKIKKNKKNNHARAA